MCTPALCVLLVLLLLLSVLFLLSAWLLPSVLAPTLLLLLLTPLVLLPVEVFNALSLAASVACESPLLLLLLSPEFALLLLFSSAATATSLLASSSLDSTLDLTITIWSLFFAAIMIETYLINNYFKFNVGLAHVSYSGAVLKCLAWDPLALLPWALCLPQLPPLRAL